MRNPAVLSVSVFALGSCTLFLAGDPALVLCDTEADCAVGVECVSGFCKGGAGNNEGEGDVVVGGEGEGDVVVGEGEGDVVTGEGEGDVVVGEGEGEPPLPPPKTCREVQDRGATASGIFAVDVDGDGVIGTGNGVDEASVFCELAVEGGGWTRVAFFDGVAGDACPAVWSERVVGAVRGCERPASAVGTAPAILANTPHAYTQVLGRVTGIVFGDADAFASHVADLNQIYVDGVSITAGSPRQHVFTFVGAHPCPIPEVQCPCRGGTGAPAFVDASFCDAPTQAARPSGCGSNNRAFDGANPLWDGPTDQCAADGDGFFNRTTLTPHTAADDLEVRLMDDQTTADENIALTHLELYVR